jgi:hypothetical protein
MVVAMTVMVVMMAVECPAGRVLAKQTEPVLADLATELGRTWM